MSDILILLVLFLFNGVFAMSEMAIAASRRARLQPLADEGSRAAKTALELAESPTRFLSTVQLFITIISIIQGLFGGQAFAGGIADFITANIPALESVAEPIGYATIVLLIAYFSLVIGELVPKRLALQSPERIAMLIARPMRILERIVTPLVWLLSRSTNLILRLLGVSASDEGSVTQIEVMAMLEEGVNTGVFEEGEQDMVAAVFRLDEQRISSLITPRTEMVWLDLNDTREANIAKMKDDSYSSYPVGRGNVDNIVGIAQAKDLLGQWMQTGELNIEAAMTAPVFVPESATVAGAIRMFKKEGVHTILVLSEYGGIEGLVRMHDVIEQIFGNLEEDETPQVRALENPATQTLDGQYALTKFMEQYPDFDLPEDESGKYETVAGFIMARLRKVPEVGETFDYEGLHFNVLTMDGVRIDSIQVDIIKPTKESQDEQS